MTYPLATLAAQVTAAGITAPSFNDIYESLKASARQIYGDDAYLEPDSQDGQMLGIYARAIYDCNQAAIGVYNCFSPQTAYGAALSNAVKINHIRRLVATNSQVNVQIGGEAGTVITAGVVEDIDGNQWNLPASVTIPLAGTITVTAVAVELGAIAAGVGTVTKIVNPTRGWQTVNNADAAVAGQPVESDAELRARQVISPALNSYTVFEGIVSSIANLEGVVEVKGYENDTNATDTNGLPPHSISMVVEGGDAAEIAQTIMTKKGVGVSTYGTTTVTVNDPLGTPRPINFYVPTPKVIDIEVRIKPLTGYVSTTADLIKQANVDFIEGLRIGDDVLITRLYLPAMLNGNALNQSYEVLTVKAAINPGAVGTVDLAIAFNEKATTALANVSIVLVP